MNCKIEFFNIKWPLELKNCTGFQFLTKQKPAKFNTKDPIFAIFRGQYQIKLMLPHKIIAKNLYYIGPVKVNQKMAFFGFVQYQFGLEPEF